MGEFVEVGARACLEDSPSSAQNENKYEEVQELYLQAVLSGQRSAAANIAAEALLKAPVSDIYSDVLQETLYEVGRKWAANEITVAEEHMATAITQYVMGKLYAQIKPNKSQQGKIVITGVESEMHQVGANMVADVLESDGWDVRFLGTNMPHAGIIQAIEEHNADVLGISTTMLFNLPHALRLVGEVREKMKDKTPRIVLGGRAFASVPSLWKEIGAEGVGTDVRGAQALLRREDS